MNPSSPSKGGDNWVVSIIKFKTSRRTRSFSFFSSSSSSLSSMSMSSSSTSVDPAAYSWSRKSPLRLSGAVPFSWEQQPGIPKVPHLPASKDGLPCRDLQLPLPPAAAPSTTAWKKKKVPLYEEIEEDPFMAALMECSKDHHQQLRNSSHQSYDLKVEEDLGSKVSRSLSDRFGSCKRSCSVADSTVLLRKPNRRGYYLLDRRSG